jgi:NADPH:quinone reductase and related Zn-dependent oxidoreductases
VSTRIEAYELAAGSTSLRGLARVWRTMPVPAHDQVLVRIKAASLNFRDVAIASNRYFLEPIARDTVPLSDGCGEVVAVGESVSTISPGDRVVATFKQGRLSLGVPLDGTLAEYAVFNEDGVLPIPVGLTFQEAATLPIAAVTAWNALCEGRGIRSGETVLTLGTGGVSMFALQLAKAAGARVIVTSSDDDKLQRAKELGADEVINFSRNPDWASKVIEVTNNAGVDKIIELFGAATLPQSFRAIGEGGEIALVAESTKSSGTLEPYALIKKSATLRGIACGTKSHFIKVNAAISVNRIHPVINSIYSFDQAIDAYRDMNANQHVGKMVIRF